MGSPSFFEWEDIKVIDKDGLKEFRDKVLKAPVYPEIKEGYRESFDYKSYKEYWDQIKPEEFTFEAFHEWKIISYWYSEFIAFLRDIAMFIEGEVHFSFESNDQASYITFENGKAIINIGEMKYTKHTPEYFGKIPKQPKSMKERHTQINILQKV